MSSKEAYEIAIKMSDSVLKTVGFFIAICTLFGGWIVAGEYIKDLRSFGFERYMFILVFTGPAAGLTYSVVESFGRVNAVLTHSKERMIDELNESELKAQISPMFKLANPMIPMFSMGAVIIGLDVLLLLR